jgi:TorA maturation chaperone TorD
MMSIGDSERTHMTTIAESPTSNINERHDMGKKRGKNMGWVAQFEGQMLVCGLLAKALYGAPDRPWLNVLSRKRVFDSIPFGSDLPEIASALECLQRWTKNASGGLNDDAFERISDDYTCLFVGPNQLLAAPWESVYTNKDRAVFQRETVSVKNWYLRFDLALATEYNEPADHVGLEFGFLAHLAELTIAASDIRDGAEVKRLIDAQRAFLAHHILPWVPRWANEVIEHARTDFYRGLASLARGTALEAGSFFFAGTQAKKQAGAFRKTDSSQK